MFFSHALPVPQCPLGIYNQFVLNYSLCSLFWNTLDVSKIFFFQIAEPSTDGYTTQHSIGYGVDLLNRIAQFNFKSLFVDKKFKKISYSGCLHQAHGPLADIFTTPHQKRLSLWSNGYSIEWRSPWSDTKVSVKAGHILRPSTVSRATELCPAIPETFCHFKEI